MSSLAVAEHIQERLRGREELTALVGERMYPLAVAAETVFPFVAYERTSVQPLRTKDLYAGEDAVTVDVYVMADNYGASVAVAEEVRAALDGSSGRYEGLQVGACYLSDAEEHYSEGVYVQRLEFSMTTITE